MALVVHDLSQALLAAAGASGTALQSVPDLEETLRALVAIAVAAWPAFDITPEGFVRHLAARLPKFQRPEDALTRVHASDLYLACALTHGDARALAEFEHRFMPAVSLYVARVDRSPAFADEVRQLLRQRLFVGDGRTRPKIADYGGTGPLAGWLRLAAARTAMNLRRGDKPGVAIERGADIRAPGMDPELAYLKRRYAAEFRQAFEQTLAALSTKEKTLLRLYYLDGLSKGAIGEVLGVHRATVKRWIDDARRSIFEETCRLLRDRLALSPAEFESVLGLVRSQLDQSISGLLRQPAPDPSG